MDRERVTAIIPARNEAAAIGGVVRGLIEHVPGLVEVLVVDDGSTDDTSNEAEAAGATVIRRARSEGKGCAVRAGIAAARGDVLILIDGDGQDDPSEAPHLLAALGPGVAMAVGSRFLGRIAEGGITPLNRLGNVALTRLFNLLFGTSLTDTQAGFRAIRRSLVPLERLGARAFELETDLTLLALAGGGRVVEVPVSRLPRAEGTSYFIRPYHGLRILGWMVRGAFERRMAAPGGRP